MKCDHIIGYSAGIEGGWLTKWSKSGQDLDDLETRFKFCPECGENIENLKLKRRYNHPKWNSEMTPIMKKLNEDISVHMVTKFLAGNSVRSLMDPGKWSREFTCGEGETIKNIIKERE